MLNFKQIQVDDADWTATYKIVVDMNMKYDRSEYYMEEIIMDLIVLSNASSELSNPLNS